MTMSNEMQAVIDRILHKTPADGDTEALRQWLQTPEGQKFAQQITQPAPPPTASSKYNFTIGNMTANEIQYGDKIYNYGGVSYNGTDVETLKNLVSSLVKESPTPAVAVRKILVIAASPEHEKLSRLNLEKEVKEIDQALRLGKHREQFTLDQRWGVSRRDLQGILLDTEPDIVHFSGHGAKEKGLVLQTDNQQPELVSTASLAKLFELINRGPNPIACIVLNACYSEAQANAMSPFIDYIIGMDKEIGDTAAIELSRGFYRFLSSGYPYDAAFEFGCNAIDLAAIPEHLTPVLKGKAVQP